jgi:hypothetical protein
VGERGEDAGDAGQDERQDDRRPGVADRLPDDDENPMPMIAPRPSAVSSREPTERCSPCSAVASPALSAGLRVRRPAADMARGFTARGRRQHGGRRRPLGPAATRRDPSSPA